MNRPAYPTIRSVAPALTLSAAFLVAGPVSAAYPEFNSIQPRGAQRGTEVEVTLSGNRLADAEEIISYAPENIKVLDFKIENPTTLKARFQLAPNCPLGEHLFRVRCKSGISYARNFFAGQFPSVEEKEPNTVITEAQPITTGVTLSGTAKNEDTDYYKVECKKGERLSVEVEGIRLCTNFWDPYVAILNSKKFELAVSDDSPLGIQDGHVSVIIPEDGTYYVEVRDSSYAGNDGAQYRVHVGAFPRPTVAYPPGGKTGTEMEVTFLGDAGGPFTQKVTIPATPGEVMKLEAKAHGLSAPSPNLFRITSLDNSMEAGASQRTSSQRSTSWPSGTL